MRVVLSLIGLFLIPLPAHAQCTADDQCKAGRFCLGGVCRDWAGQCFKDVDCQGDLLCEGGRCGGQPVQSEPVVQPAPVQPAPVQPTTAPAGPYVAQVGTFDREDANKISRRLTAEFQGKGFYLSYKFLQTRDDDEHEFVFSDLGFYFRFDIDQELKIKGDDRESERFRKWKEEDDDGPNEVQVWFDGTYILIDANGERLGPVQVVEDPRREVGRWKISITGGDAQVQDLVVKAWDGSLKD